LPLCVTNTVDSSLSLSGSKILKNLLRMFSKKQEKSVIGNSLTEESEVSENEVYFNLKGESSDLGQEEEEEMEFKEKLEKIERDQTGLSCGSVTNDVSKGGTATVPRDTALIQGLTILVKGMVDSQKHEKIPQLERLELGGEKGNCGRVFQFIFQLDKRLEAYRKDEEEKK
jgi:hypothetical protein